jgi:hypothetical protein
MPGIKMVNLNATTIEKDGDLLWVMEGDRVVCEAHQLSEGETAEEIRACGYIPHPVKLESETVWVMEAELAEAAEPRTVSEIDYSLLEGCKLTALGHYPDRLGRRHQAFSHEGLHRDKHDGIISELGGIHYGPVLTFPQSQRLMEAIAYTYGVFNVENWCHRYLWSLTPIAETIAAKGLELVETTGYLAPGKEDGWLQFAIHRKIPRDQDGNLEDVPAYTYGCVFAYVLGEHTPEDPLIEVVLAPESNLDEDAISVVRWLRKAIVPKRP